MKALNRKQAQIENSYPVKLIQIGGGNFLRAFVDWMVSKMNDQGLFNGSIAVVKATPGGDYQELRHQDGLFHVVVRGFQNGKTVDEIDLVSSIEEIIQPFNDYSDFLALATTDELSVVVSNTTEAGIVYEQIDELPDFAPISFPALLTAFLWKRYSHFEGDMDKGLIVLPCELIESNGEKLLSIILKHANDWKLDRRFLDWVAKANIFANTLVDRIVPGYPQEDATMLGEKVGYVDKLLVAAEPYHLFVIQAEGDIATKFPLGKAGINAIFTDDLSMYRDRKVGILNGAHTSMVPVGILAGIKTVRDFVDDTSLLDWLNTLIEDEVIPSLAYPDEMLLSYKNEVLDRFRNPFVEHRLESIALNSISKFKTRILPVFLNYVGLKKELPGKLTLVLAALLKMYEGTWQGENLTLNDDPALMARLSDIWKLYRSGSLKLDEMVAKCLSFEIWGKDLNAVPGLNDTVCGYLKDMEQNGIRVIL